MNCEQVEELLSAYLDDALAFGEMRVAASHLRLGIAAHLDTCFSCSTLLAEYRRFDILFSQLPRISPSPRLRDRIFSSPEYLELTGTYNSGALSDKGAAAYKNARYDRLGRPQLVALPGGRCFSSASLTRSKPYSPAQTREATLTSARSRRFLQRFRLLQVAIVAAILTILVFGSFIGWNLWLQQNKTIKMSGSMTPSAAPQHGTLPLPAGMHLVFLRNDMLWSIPVDNSTPAEQLTPDNVTVSAKWVVSSPLPGRSAGDLLAYIDLREALVHIIRSDGQRDIILQQPLLKIGVQPSSVWDTNTGEAILNSLAWANDGTRLAFVADPQGTGLTSLFLFSPGTSVIQMVPLPTKGSVSNPVWSPDGIRVAFELTHDRVESIWDYNTQNHGWLIITNGVIYPDPSNDTILSLDWSPSLYTPAITWSVGVIGHVHSIWLRHVGFDSTTSPQILIRGDYVQAIYSRNAQGRIGSWLLVSSIAGRAGNLWLDDIIPGAIPHPLTTGKQVNYAEWSPDGTQVDYLDAISSGVGTLHILNLTTVIDTLIAPYVAYEPSPAWSTNQQELVYSTGTQTIVVNLLATKTVQILKLRGLASSFIWSVTSPHQLIIALGDGEQGIYQVDTQRNTVLQIDQQDSTGSFLWTEVP